MSDELPIAPDGDVIPGYKRTDRWCILINRDDYEQLQSRTSDEMRAIVVSLPEEFEDEE